MRAIYAETLKTRLDDDGQLTGYLDEMINDCPSVRQDINALVDEIYTDAMVRDYWGGEESAIKRLSKHRARLCARSMVLSRVECLWDEFPDMVDQIYMALRKGSQSDVEAKLEAFDEQLARMAIACLNAAGFLQIDMEKTMRRLIADARGVRRKEPEAQDETTCD